MLHFHYQQAETAPVIWFSTLECATNLAQKVSEGRCALNTGTALGGAENVGGKMDGVGGLEPPNVRIKI